MLLVFVGCGGGSSPGYAIDDKLTGVFLDCAVEGLVYQTPTQSGRTDASGVFIYLEDEDVTFSTGNAVLGTVRGKKIVSPLDFISGREMQNPVVINIARLLQCMDSNGVLQDGIRITEASVDCLDAAMAALDLSSVDWADTPQVNEIIDLMMGLAAQEPALDLTAHSAADALAHLEDTLGEQNVIFRKNVSKTPELANAKAKLQILQVYVPAYSADGTRLPLFTRYVDEDGNPSPYDADGDPRPMLGKVNPLVIAYAAEHPEEPGSYDTYCAVSLDDGNTWKRFNISRSADESSFTLENGYEYLGTVKKPVIQARKDCVFLAWQSKYAPRGIPNSMRAKALAQIAAWFDEYWDAADPNDPPVQPGVDDYAPPGDVNADGKLNLDDLEAAAALVGAPYDRGLFDPYLVIGPQRSVDYTGDEDAPEGLGEVPFSAVWTARLVIDGKAATFNEMFRIFRPEQVTCARRDAIQTFAGGTPDGGFAIVWQEDPEGLRFGKGAGPGEGGSGATVNHHTDIWYSYIAWDQFGEDDPDFVPQGDSQSETADGIGRQSALYPMSPPIRLSDNMACRFVDAALDAPGENQDGERLKGPFMGWMKTLDPAPYITDGAFDRVAYEQALWAGRLDDPPTLTRVQFETEHGDADYRWFATLPDGTVLDGDTGASRAVVMIQKKGIKAKDGTILGYSAECMIAYEESKGLGTGPSLDDHDHDATVQHDHEADGSGDGDPSTDKVRYGKNVQYHHLSWIDFGALNFALKGSPPPDPEKYSVKAGKTMNLPRPDTTYTDPDDLLAYKNARRPRLVVQGKSPASASVNKVCIVALWREGEEGLGAPADIMMRRGFHNPDAGKTGYTPKCFEPVVHNLSGSTIESWVPQEDDPLTPEDESMTLKKVTQWTFPGSDLTAIDTEENPYEDARAHRGALRGDFLIMGFVHSPNWSAARKGNDHYDFYVRRSMDGGATWQREEPWPGLDELLGPRSGGGELLSVDYGFARNVSNLPNHKESVIEPRIMAAPGSIKVSGSVADPYFDKQNTSVVWMTFGTASNNLLDPSATGKDVQVDAIPADLFYCKTTNHAGVYETVPWDRSSTDTITESIPVFPWLAKLDEVEEGEAQIRITPSGRIFYSTWLAEGYDPSDRRTGSDIWFRKIPPVANYGGSGQGD